jgi:hypothetical protein
LQFKDAIEGVIEDLLGTTENSYLDVLEPIFTEINPFVVGSAFNNFLKTIIAVSACIRYAHGKANRCYLTGGAVIIFTGCSRCYQPLLVWLPGRRG